MISCSKCQTRVAAEAIGGEQPFPCPGCESPLQIWAFPRLLSGVPEGKPAAPVTSDAEATCFFHEGNRAEMPCEACGRYLCAICDLEIDGSHLCPTCVDGDQGMSLPDRLVRERVLWDSVVLSLSILPMLIFYITLFTAPMTLFLGFRHLRTPTSLVRHTRFRLYLGLSIAGLQVVGWLSGLGYLIMRVMET